MMNSALMVSILLAHFMGDFLLQTNKIAALKAKDKIGVSIHCTVILMSNLILLPFGVKSIPLIILLTMVHFAIDCIKLKIKNLKVQFFYFFIDQALHFISSYVLCRLFNLHSTLITNRVIYYYEAAIFFIVITYVSTVIIKQFYFSFGFLNFKEHSFFLPKERELDMIFNLLFAVSLMLFYPYWYVVNIILGIIYIIIHMKNIKFKNSLLLGKLLFFIIFQIVCFYTFLISTAVCTIVI